VWGGCPIEPDVLLQLARHPPADAAALADVPGVGPALAEKLGGTILRALSPGSPVPVLGEENAALASLERWRAGVAREMGVPAYAVIPDAVLRAISAEQPRSRLDLARIRGVGPRTLAKFGDELLSIR
jgi:ATP-dependent DNA helicase RecQ